MGGRTGRRGVTAELRIAFLALLRETGNARLSARLLGQGDTFNNKMKRDEGFRRECREARAQAHARLKGAESPFAVGEGGQALPRAGGEKVAAAPLSAEELGGYLRPGRKRGQERVEPVVRRTNGGRAQVSLAREGHMTADIEADFLKRLRATGNLSASALAVGFQPATVRERVRRWPAFARACSEAIEEAGIALDYALVARAHALLRTDGEALPGEEEVKFDPDAAMRILAYIERRRGGGGGGRRRGKGPPQRSYEEARDSILAKIDAIERHERMAAARAGEGEA